MSRVHGGAGGTVEVAALKDVCKGGDVEGAIVEAVSNTSVDKLWQLQQVKDL